MGRHGPGASFEVRGRGSPAAKSQEEIKQRARGILAARGITVSEAW
jgi:hypothetical protein